MKQSAELTLDPGDIGGRAAVLLSHLEQGWDLVEGHDYSWDTSESDLHETLEKAGYSVDDLSARCIVTKQGEVYAHVNRFEVSAVGTSSGLATLLNVIDSNPAPEPPTPEGIYKIRFDHMFINKFDDLESSRYGFDNTSEHLANLQSELYPRVDAEKLMELYTKSDESVLILTGEPGTGKTCFTKMLCKSMSEIQKKNLNIVYVKDPKILKRDDFWIVMQNREPDLLILDDLDDELKPRVEGKNEIMNHMLSFSDGIFPKSTKIIVTTNQPNSSIDKAITRPGRCFDILALPQLTVDEAKVIWTGLFDRDSEEFNSSFGAISDRATISQAALVSEHKRLGLTERPAYLLDDSISIRTLIQEGGAANSE